MARKSIGLAWQLILPVPVALAVGIAAIWLTVPGIVADNTRDGAVSSALQTVKQFKALRAYYTKNVVAKVVGGSDLKAGIDHATNPKTIPLPATMIHDLSDLYRSEAVTIGLYSGYPFPNRRDRVLDGFEQEAWAFLTKNPDAVFSRPEVQNGKEVVRVAVADRLTAEACVSCHNSYPGTPKNDWKLGDVRGVLEVTENIERPLAQGNLLSRNIVLAMVVGGLLLMLLSVVATRRAIGPLVRLIDATKRLATGDKTLVVPALEIRNEIGEMARAVEVFKQNSIEKEELQVRQAAADAERRQHEEVERQAAEARRESEATREREAETARQRELEDRREAQEKERRSAAEERRREMLALADGFESSVKAVVDKVSTAAAGMTKTARTVSGAVETVTGKSAAVSAAAGQASANVQTVAAAAEELTASIDEIARQVAQSASIASQAVSDVDSTNVTVRGLADATQKIGKVVGMINAIASQTNLLALNATIEAARAGDAGKGFAVVASEVKALANQTAKATEEIAAQIAAMQQVSVEVVGAIENVGRTIGEINHIATTIASAVEEQGAATQEIARNVQQAASGTTEVTGNIESVTGAATDAGTSVGEFLSASDELQRQSTVLHAEVDRFLARVRSA